MMADTYLPAGMPMPAPQVDGGWDAPFWAACRRHELVVQRCSACGAMRHPPEVVCYRCSSFENDWPAVSGRGTVYSFINVEYPAHPALRERVPYNAVIVQLNEDPTVHMVGNVVDCEYDDIAIGMPVEVYFEDHPDEEVTLPLWKRAAAQG
jgi:uncharacterized OB-fold protein